MASQLYGTNAKSISEVSIVLRRCFSLFPSLKAQTVIAETPEQPKDDPGHLRRQAGRGPKRRADAKSSNDGVSPIFTTEFKIRMRENGKRTDRQRDSCAKKSHRGTEGRAGRVSSSSASLNALFLLSDHGVIKKGIGCCNLKSLCKYLRIVACGFVRNDQT